MPPVALAPALGGLDLSICCSDAADSVTEDSLAYLGRCTSIRMPYSSRTGRRPPLARGLSMPDPKNHLGELRLLLEGLCCDLCRFEHVIADGLSPEAIRIDREYWLGTPGAFADIMVAPAGRPAYFVEVKFGYRNDNLLRHLLRKYSS